MSNNDAGQEALNEEQSAAAYADPRGILFVRALAGSGKTRMLRYRVPHIIDYRNGKYQSQSRVLVLAFGKDVAAEIRNYFKNNFPEELTEGREPRIDVRTFHSMASTMLGKFKRNTPLALVEKFECPKPGILAGALQDYLSEEHGLSLEMRDIKILIGLEDYANARGMDIPEAMDEMPREARNVLGMTPLVVEAWLQKMREFRYSTGNLTFTDLLHLATQLPDNCYRALNFKDVLADELQDLNHLQRLMVKKFMDHAQSFTGVGDSNQAIFGFAGADAKIFERMRATYPDAQELTLTTNYRCTEPIIELANQVLTHDIKTRMRLKGLGNNGPAPAVYTNGGRGLIDWLKSRQASGENWKDMAVLYRTKAQAPQLEMALAEAKIPYVLTDMSFFEQAEINDMMAYIKLLYDPTVGYAEWRRVVSHFPGLGVATAKETWATSNGRPFTHTFQTAPSTVHTDKQRESWAELTERMFDLVSNQHQPTDAARLVLDGMYNYWCGEYGDDMEKMAQRLECAQAFVNWVGSFGEGVVGWDIIQAVKRYEEGNRHEDPESDAIRVTTIHKSKGREWDNVALWNVGPGTLPLKVRTRDEQAEENRLLYVAVTRARKGLALICPTEEAAKQSTLASYCPNTTDMAAAMFKITDQLPPGVTVEDVPELDWLLKGTP